MRTRLPLRHILDLPRRDVAVYEHKRTGERRNVTGKERATFGLDEAKSDDTGQTDVVS